MLDSSRCGRLKAFEGYVSAYDLDDERVALKIEHSYKVASLCEEIAANAGMAAEDVDLAWLCGLLHDIGRFEQLRRFGTFNDTCSVRHAQLGVDVLCGRDGGISDGRMERFSVPEDEAGLVLQAVGLHGDLSLPVDLDPRVRVFCELLRDADKVDIVRVFGHSDCEAVLGLSPDEFVRGTISDEAMDGFKKRRCLGPEDRQGDLDGLVGVLCLPFELVNVSARIALWIFGYLEKLMKEPFGLRPNFVNLDTKEKWLEITNFYENEYSI